ncbi:MAG: hypothetical protein NVSMB9_26090 [Isosphaeraceae bacterium]
MTAISTELPNAGFDWKLWPETELFLGRCIAAALAGNDFASQLAARMRDETNTKLSAWIDHLVISERTERSKELETLGYVPQSDLYAANHQVYAHQGGSFPRIALAPANGPDVREVAIKVESVAAFSRAFDLGLEVSGDPFNRYRVGRISGTTTSLAVVERRGYRGVNVLSRESTDPRVSRLPSVSNVLAAYEIWYGRRRRFDEDEEGFLATETLLQRIIELAGSRALACDLVFQAERAYWESRNRAARAQKARQDRLGLGWANHDHHTFRSSRGNFPRLIRMFESLGFVLRERFHAGEHAGWGAQILEHPTTGIVIFADLDLAPEEATIDFAHQPLPDLPRPNTVGLWVGLHGESILEAGMHHL